MAKIYMDFTLGFDNVWISFIQGFGSFNTYLNYSIALIIISSPIPTILQIPFTTLNVTYKCL